MTTAIDNEAGSYCFGGFQENDLELTRLRKQAFATLSLEQQLWGQVGLRPGMRVLDLACGPGIISCEIARHIAPGHVVGVDLSEPLLSTARRHCDDVGRRNVEFHTGSVYELDESLGQFDFVYARVLFQHLESPSHALQSVRNVVKPGGTLCIVDVDDRWLTFEPYADEFDQLTRLAGEGQRQRGGNRHIGRQLSSLLKRSGFEDVRCGILPFTTDDVGVEAFLDITTGFKLEQIDPDLRPHVREQLERIYTATDDPLAWGAVGIFHATGQRGDG